MTTIEAIVGEAAIGIGASLAAMAWPMRRGVIGIALNAIVGIAGAWLFAYLGYLLSLYTDRTSGGAFALAAIGAVVSLVGMHVIWTIAHPNLPRPVATAEHSRRF